MQDNRRIFPRGAYVDDWEAKGETLYDKVVQWGDREGEEEALAASVSASASEGKEARWPVVQTEEKTVQVLSRNRSWGVRVTKNGEGALQLYVLKIGEETKGLGSG